MSGKALKKVLGVYPCEVMSGLFACTLVVISLCCLHNELTLFCANKSQNCAST